MFGTDYLPPIDSSIDQGTIQQQRRFKFKDTYTNLNPYDYLETAPDPRANNGVPGDHDEADEDEDDPGQGLNSRPEVVPLKGGAYEDQWSDDEPDSLPKTHRSPSPASSTLSPTNAGSQKDDDAEVIGGDATAAGDDEGPKFPDWKSKFGRTASKPASAQTKKWWEDNTMEFLPPLEVGTPQMQSQLIHGPPPTLPPAQAAEASEEDERNWSNGSRWTGTKLRRIFTIEEEEIKEDGAAVEPQRKSPNPLHRGEGEDEVFVPKPKFGRHHHNHPPHSPHSPHSPQGTPARKAVNTIDLLGEGYLPPLEKPPELNLPSDDEQETGDREEERASSSGGSVKDLREEDDDVSLDQFQGFEARDKLGRRKGPASPTSPPVYLAPLDQAPAGSAVSPSQSSIFGRRKPNSSLELPAKARAPVSPRSSLDPEVLTMSPTPSPSGSARLSGFFGHKGEEEDRRGQSSKPRQRAYTEPVKDGSDPSDSDLGEREPSRDNPSPTQEVKETSVIDLKLAQNGNKMINNYAVLFELGRGASGKVKAVIDVETEQRYAMKIVKKQTRKKFGVRGPSLTDKVMVEIAILKKCNHPNVVKLIEVLDNPTTDKIYLGKEDVSFYSFGCS